MIRSRQADAPCSASTGPWVILATVLGSGMAFIDTSVVNVALPAMQADLGASAAETQWVVTSYALFLAALILVGGSLGDHYGRRRGFLLGIALFAVASVLCGLSQGVGQLIAARALQGIGGAMLVPGSLAIIGASFEKERRGAAIGAWAAFTGLISLLGPVAGGWLIENISWRAAFFVNVPLAAAVLAVGLWRLPESRDESARRLDLPGSLLATLGLAGLVYGLIRASGSIDAAALVALAAGVLSLIGFVLVEARGREPMMPLSMFRSRNFSGANAFTLLLYFAIGGAFYFLPFNLQQAQGYSAAATGAAFAPAILTSFLFSRPAGSLADRFGPRLPMVAGSVLAALGIALFALPGPQGGSYWTTFFPAMLVLGLGLAVHAPALTTTALSSVDGEHSGLASGANNAVSRAAGLLAIPVLGFLMFAAFSPALDRGVSDLGLPPAALAALEKEKADLGAARVPDGMVDDETGAAVERAVEEAYVTGFRLVMLVAAGLALTSGVAAVAMMEGPKKKPLER